MVRRRASLRASSLAAGLAVLTVVSNAAAELTVIYDSGDAKPLAPLLGPLRAARRDQEPEREEGASLGAAELEAILPILSPGLTPGIVSGRPYVQPYTRPFFLVGADTRSQRWLQQHRAMLKRLGAVGMLVEAHSIEDVQIMRTLADGLSLLPASGTDIAQALGIEHYPVAVTEGRLWQ